MNTQRKIIRKARKTTPDGDDAVFYEIYDVLEVEGKEILHLRSDASFKTLEEAEKWVSHEPN